MGVTFYVLHKCLDDRNQAIQHRKMSIALFKKYTYQLFGRTLIHLRIFIEMNISGANGGLPGGVPEAQYEMHTIVAKTTFHVHHFMLSCEFSCF